jgi:Bacterial membrane protein YfhO
MKTRFKFFKVLSGYAVVFIWPFIYCYKYVLSGRSYSLTIGNDFNVLYTYKLILLDRLSNFNLPLWSPSEGCGYAFYSNPFTQTFYPLNALLVLLYKFNNGYSYADNQKFTVLGLAIFAVGMLLWLRSLKVETRYAVFSICLVTVSSRLIEILRFTNAVHTIAWIPFILYGCTIALDSRKKFKSGLIIFISFIMMVTAGYTYYVYYCAFLIFPYLLLLIYVRQKKYCLTVYDFNIKKYFLVIALSFITAFAVCYPYLSKVKQLIDQTDLRGGSNFEYSTLHKFTFTDTIGSLIYPPAAHIEGWYYFGMMSILIVICMYLYFIVNRAQYRKQFFLLCVITFWFIVISYITYGEQSYLFKFLWHYFPGFSALRIWGRMNIIFVPVYAFLFAVAVKLFLKKIATKENEGSKERSRFKYFLILFMSAYLIIISAQIYFFNNKVFDFHSLNYFKSFMSPDFDEKNFIKYSISSFAVLLILIFAGRYAGFIKKKNLGAVFFAVVFIINTLDLYHANSNQWAIVKSPDTERKKVTIDELDVRSLTTPRVAKNAMINISPNFSAGYVDEWYYERFVKFFKSYENGEDSTLAENFDELMGLNDGKRIFCSYKIENSINEFIEDSRKYESTEVTKLEIESYDGDELVCTIDTKKNGYCSFIDNWDPDWKATVNGRDVSIEKLFGTFKSVRLEKGGNVIRFKYSPDFFKW